MKTNRFLLAVGIVLALAFIFSCSSDDGGDPPPPPLSSSGGSSSSSDGLPSSSSEEPSSSSVVPSSSSSAPHCGEEQYNPVTEACCGNGKYTLATQFCHEGTPHNKCGGKDYDPLAEYCHGDQISSCDVPHTSDEFCFDGTIYEKCDGEEYDPDSHFCDARNGSKLYGYVVIGAQTWMAENLNYKTDNSASRCYPISGNTNPNDDDNDNCDTYGRLYDWATAMNGAASSTTNPSGRQGVCPDGWHLPSNAEWTVLTDFVGGSTTAGTKLKATDGWNNNGNGTDEYGFSALPGGSGTSSGTFVSVRNNGLWWSATQYGENNAYSRAIYYTTANVGSRDDIKSSLFSVRCVMD